LWKKTLEILKDQLSPEVLEKYGTVLEELPTQDSSTEALEARASGTPALGEATVTSGEMEFSEDKNPLPEETVEEKSTEIVSFSKETAEEKSVEIPEGTVEEKRMETPDKAVEEKSTEIVHFSEETAEEKSVPDKAVDEKSIKGAPLPQETGEEN